MMKQMDKIILAMKNNIVEKLLIISGKSEEYYKDMTKRLNLCNNKFNLFTF